MRTLLEELRVNHAGNYGWALACCGWQRELAEDVLQEAYLRVLDGRAEFAGRSTTRTWFFGVIKHVASEVQRKQTRRAILNLRAVESDSLDVHSVSSADSTEPLQADESKSALHAALLQLSSRQREILHLVFYSELTLEETAKTMQLSVGSVRTHYHRGKARLSELLQQEENNE